MQEIISTVSLYRSVQAKCNQLSADLEAAVSDVSVMNSLIIKLYLSIMVCKDY